MGSNIVTTLVEAITGFVTGMSTAFVEAFQRIFMVEVDGAFTSLSNLGVFLVVMMGIGFGYGVIRWITGLFRRETR